jgi:hypothetical protein
MIRRQYNKIPFAIEGNVTKVGDSYILKNEDGESARIADYKDGNLFFKKPAIRGYKHPWEMQLTWHDEIDVRSEQGTKNCRKAGYYLTVEPGFVNGLDPYIEAANAYPDQIPISPKSIDPSNPATPPKAYSFGEKNKLTSGYRVPGLLERPFVLVPSTAFNNVGGEGSGFNDKGAIKFFEQKYKYDPRAASQVGGGNMNFNGSSLTIDMSQPSTQLWLGFCDVYLATARIGSTFTPELGGFPITAIEYTVQYNDRLLKLYGSRSRVRFGTMPTPLTLQQKALLKTMGQPVEEETEDYLKLATLFILKEGDPSAAKLPFDGKEIPFIKHDVYWNLEYRSKNVDPVNMPSMNASLAFLPLVGRYSIAPIAMAATMESMLNAAIASLANEVNNQGEYWSV